MGFEASVGGGIPIMRTLREALAGDRQRAIYGIVNGTCNSILTMMTDGGAEFADALAAAQRSGLAEADPTLDIEGHDAAHKLCLLVTLAFGASLKPAQVYTEGISRVTRADIAYARELGYTIKLLAIAKDDDGAIEARVHPTMIPTRHLLASVGDAFNAIYVNSEALGATMYYGRGAGMMPTATAVVADILEIARQRLAESRAGAHPLGYPSALGPPRTCQADGRRAMRVLPPVHGAGPAGRARHDCFGAGPQPDIDRVGDSAGTRSGDHGAGHHANPSGP